MGQETEFYPWLRLTGRTLDKPHGFPGSGSSCGIQSDASRSHVDVKGKLI